ncbi:MAG: acyltransferase [Desulfamplus sp.]|nr:acyltransferase [Desulfamplus sp.]
MKDFKKIGDNIVFELNVLVFHPENISLGSNIYIGHNSILKGYCENEMIINNDTWIGQGCFFHSAGGITIGQAVGIGPYVKILTSFHKETNINIPVMHNRLDFEPVTIKDGADIGVGTIVLPGTTIGEGAIIGAGSIITKNIPDYAVAFGSPAVVSRIRK